MANPDNGQSFYESYQLVSLSATADPRQADWLTADKRFFQEVLAPIYPYPNSLRK